LPIFANRWVNDKTMIYICKLGMCQLPVEQLSEALALLNL